MRILLIAGLAESLLNFRGALISEFRSRGCDVCVAAPDFTVNDSYRLALEEQGVTVYEVPLQRSGINPLVDILTLWALYRLMHRVRPDAVLGYTIKPVIYGILAARLAAVPHRFALITGLGYAFTGNATGLRSLVKRVAIGLYKLSLSFSHKVFFQNPDDLALFEQMNLLREHTSTAVINGSGVDVDYFNFQPIPNGEFNFLLIARLLGDKGVREYVEAARRVKMQYPDVCFSVVGWLDENPDSISEEELAKWVEAGDLDFLGVLPDVRSVIAQCSVYVLPSYREGTPRTVLEAMSIGRAIITTDAPGCRETVIDGDNGYLVPVKSVDALEEAMRKFVENPMLAEKMGRRSRTIAEEKYDVNKVNAMILHEMGLF